MSTNTSGIFCLFLGLRHAFEKVSVVHSIRFMSCIQEGFCCVFWRRVYSVYFVASFKNKSKEKRGLTPIAALYNG